MSEKEKSEVLAKEKKPQEGPRAVINGQVFIPRRGIRYRQDYVKLYEEVRDGKLPAKETYQKLFAEDSFAFLFFILCGKKFNHPFIVQACREVDEGPQTHTLDLWARGHLKTTIVSTIKSIQDVIKDPETTVGIFSYKKGLAQDIMFGIKQILENSEFLKALYPDVFWKNPPSESPRWSLDSGLVVKRGSSGRREATFEAAGLVEGMPIGKHYDLRVYDDVETMDLVSTPEAIEKLCNAFDMSRNLASDDGKERIVGTTYHHTALLNRLRVRKKTNGQLSYFTRTKPATIDGTPNGRSVFLPEHVLDELRVNRQAFFSQQLLDPTPQAAQKLNPSHLKVVSSFEIPKNLMKFMVVDPAGSSRSTGKDPDSWAMLIIGIEPYMDELGASRVYILDGICAPMEHEMAMRSAVELYSRNGRIMTIGVEKIGTTTFEIHMANAMRAKGKFLTVENGGITILRPANREKRFRIEGNLSWPLVHGKIHVSKDLPLAVLERIKYEMVRFPFWHDDALDALSYFYDLVKSYKFGKPREQKEEPTIWDRISQSKKSGSSRNWYYC